jgi:tryptophan-rich sensory protein
MTDLTMRGLAATGSFDGAAERTMPKRSRAEHCVAAAIFVAATVAVAVIGSVVNNAAMNWYDALEQPSIAPPGPTFGIVWTIPYVMIAIVVSALVARQVSRPAALLLVPYIAWVAFAAALNAAYAFENFA